MTKRYTEREHCRKCGLHRDVVGGMSHTGQCRSCAAIALEENVYGLYYHQGPAFERWRRGMAASIGLALPPVKA